MNKNTLFKISDEVAQKIKEHFASTDFQTQLKALKDVGADNGTFRMVISTDNVDRHGEVIMQDGWVLDNYLTNPIVLWGHDSFSIPIGITDKLVVEINNGQKALVAEGRFAGHEFAQTLRQLYDTGILKASSVGFIPLEYEGNTIMKAELLEWSFVSIPANPYALDAQKSGFNIEMLTAKGIIEVKEGEVVDNKEEKKDDEPVVDNTVDNEKNEVDNEPELDDAVISDDEKSLTMKFSNGTEKQYIFSEKYVVEKAGRVLSKSNKEKIINAKIALEEVIKMAEDGENQDTPTDNNTEGEKAQGEIQEGEEFLKLRRSVQGVATLISDILSTAKKDASEKGIKVR